MLLACHTTRAPPTHTRLRARPRPHCSRLAGRSMRAPTGPRSERLSERVGVGVGARERAIRAMCECDESDMTCRMWLTWARVRRRETRGWVWVGGWVVGRCRVGQVRRPCSPLWPERLQQQQHPSHEPVAGNTPSATDCKRPQRPQRPSPPAQTQAQAPAPAKPDASGSQAAEAPSGEASSSSPEPSSAAMPCLYC